MSARSTWWSSTKPIFFLKDKGIGYITVFPPLPLLLPFCIVWAHLPSRLFPPISPYSFYNRKAWATTICPFLRLQMTCFPTHSFSSSFLLTTPYLFFYNRATWANYFQQQGLRYAFFSAYIEEMKAEDPDFVVKPDTNPETHIYTKEELIKLFTDLCPKPIGMFSFFPL